MWACVRVLYECVSWPVGSNCRHGGDQVVVESLLLCVVMAASELTGARVCVGGLRGSVRGATTGRCIVRGCVCVSGAPPLLVCLFVFFFFRCFFFLFLLLGFSWFSVAWRWGFVAVVFCSARVAA